MDPAFLPLPNEPLCSPSIPGLVFQGGCHPDIGQENKLMGLSLCSSPSQFWIFGVLLIYSLLFISCTIPLSVWSSQKTETSIKLISLPPGPCRKEPIIASHAQEFLMNADTHVCVRQPGMCPADTPSHHTGKVREEGLPPNGREKSHCK